MLLTADQLLAHAVGDYILQSDWMARNKTSKTLAAALHAVTYTVPFLLLTQSVTALAFICGTHFLVDRFRLARFVVWLKNGASGKVTATGYPEEMPPWMSVWLLIVADNIIHVLLNAVAIKFL